MFHKLLIHGSEHNKHSLFTASILIILCLSITLRIHSIHSHGIWYDESFSGLVLVDSWQNATKTIIGDVHPPLYYFLLKSWSEIMGTSTYSMRYFSLIFSFFTFGILYLSCGLISKSYLFRFSVLLLYSISPFYIQYAGEARAYSMFCFFLLLSFYFFLKASSIQKTRINRQWIFFSLALLASYYTHYFTCLAVIVYGCTHLYWLVLNNFKNKQFCFNRFVKETLHIFGIYLIFIIGFFLWLPILLDQLGNILGWVPKVKLINIPQSFIAFLIGVDFHTTGYPRPNIITAFQGIKLYNYHFSLLFAFILSFILGLNIKKIITDQKKLLILCLCLLPLVIVALLSHFFNVNLYVERFLSPFGLFYLMLLSILFYKNRTTMICFLSLYVALLIFGIKPRKIDWKYEETTAYLRSRPEKNILIDNPFHLLPIKYLLAGSDHTIQYLNGKYIKWPHIAYDNQLIDNRKSKLKPENTLFLSVPDNRNQFSRYHLQLIKKIDRYKIFIMKPSK